MKLLIECVLVQYVNLSWDHISSKETISSAFNSVNPLIKHRNNLRVYKVYRHYMFSLLPNCYPL